MRFPPVRAAAVAHQGNRPKNGPKRSTSRGRRVWNSKCDRRSAGGGWLCFKLFTLGSREREREQCQGVVSLTGSSHTWATEEEESGRGSERRINRARSQRAKKKPNQQQKWRSPPKFKHSLAVEDAAILVLEAMEGKVDCRNV